MKVHSFLKKKGISPNPYMDQCFMTSDEIIQRMVDAAGVGDKIVLEVGAGTGLLTRKMMYKASKVVCVEKDVRLCSVLKELFRDKKVEIVCGDIIRHGFKDYKTIVGNLPYTIIDWFFKKLLRHDFERSVVTISNKAYKKVMEDKLVSSYLKIRKVCNVPRTSFWPAPKNHSVLLLIVPEKKNTEIRFFYEKNYNKKVSEVKMDVNERLANKKIRDLSGRELSHLFNSVYAKQE